MMSAVLKPFTDNRQEIFLTLLSQQAAIPQNNAVWLSKIMASWLCGQSVLPDYLGLTPAQFIHLTKTYFPQTVISHQAPSGIVLDFQRMLEKEDLINLFQQHARSDNQETGLIAELIVSACLGNDHLWQDLGVWRRSELSELLAFNFPTLAQRNDKNMKWKKFLYKQLCEAEGMNLCRAPSCEVCMDYEVCFGSED